jgi:hypothetical protein
MIRQPLYNCSTARFDGSARALTEDELRRAAPSIFAATAHESRSTRFAPIPTIEPLRALQAEGFFPVAARQSNARDESRLDFTKHMIRLRRLDDDAKHRVGDTVCEVILKNANDGSSAYDLLAGLFRIRCLNSLVVQTGSIDTVKVRHTGDVTGKVIEGTYSVISEAQKALAAPDGWSALPMSRDARGAFAEAAHVLRFGDEDGNVTTTVEPGQLLQVRRGADQGQDLWTTYNVVQENAVRGGVQGHPRIDENGRQRRVRPTRAIRGIDQDVKLNKALFVLAERMSQMLRNAA